jgi:hypothetical protein
MDIATLADLRKLIGDQDLAGLAAEQIIALIHEARCELRETGDPVHVADAARRLATSMPRWR